MTEIKAQTIGPCPFCGKLLAYSLDPKLLPPDPEIGELSEREDEFWREIYMRTRTMFSADSGGRDAAEAADYAVLRRRLRVPKGPYR